MTLSEDGLLAWVPSVAQAGWHNVEVKIWDSNGGVITVAGTITVSHQSIYHTPVITSVPDIRINLTKELAYEVQDTNADGDTLI